MKISTDKGFTMLEVLLVITLLSILFAIIVNSIQPLSILTRSEDRRKEADALTIYQALEQYSIKNNSYPDSIKNMPNNTSFDICKTTASSCPSPKINLSSILVPTYFSKVPEYSTDSINTGFYIVKDDNGRVGIGGTRKLDNTAFIKGLENQSFENIVTDGLVLHLDAANPASYPGTGNTWFDLSGNGKNGTLNTATSFNTSGYFSIDGTSGTRITTSGPLNPTVWSDPITLEVWTYFDSDGTWDNGYNGGLFSRGSTAGTFGLVRRNSDNSVGIWLRDNISIASISSTIQRDTWYQIVGTWDGVQSLTFFINGVETTSTTKTASGAPDLGGYSLGGMTSTLSGSPGNFMKGRIANVKLYNLALNKEKVQQNFNATKGRFGL
jgi:prepilin-type N-terminal cleavage/methylation domain-containing protein